LVKKYPPTQVHELKVLLRSAGLHTVCEEARCPNIGECFSRRALTFMILGDRCTRSCRFCAVDKRLPGPPDPAEPERVAEVSARLGLRYVVITSVTRDDLPDGGAEQFARTVTAVRQACPEAKVEVLIPDLSGNRKALERILASRPDVLGHNLETVPRLYPEIRPQAVYERSLHILLWTKELAPQVFTRSALLLGLGERRGEVERVLGDLRQVGCDFVTLGQYLQPKKEAWPVAEYLPPEVFEEYGRLGRDLGFRQVVSAPFARSSYLAHGWTEGDHG